MKTSKLAIALLGEFSIMMADGTPVHLNGDRPISLLAYLLLHRHTPVARQHLAFTLWPDSSDSQARTNLRNLLFTLRRTLPNAGIVVAADTMTLQWRGDADYTLDVAEFETALAAAKAATAPAAQIAHLEAAVARYTGDLLPNNYDDWIIPAREELRNAYISALHRLMALLEEQSDTRAAIRYGQRLLQLDPLDEPATVQLMRLHALSGDRAGVRRIYDQCVALLRRELDVEPSPATQTAYAQLLRLDVPVPVEEPAPAPTPPPKPRALPTPATAFVGREAELAQVAELLAEPACRLLTIIGPGGVGKTRLALESAAGHQRLFAGGALWVALANLQCADQIATAVAEALNRPLRGAANPQAELIRVLADQELLLVLDNFEHLLDAADLLTEILAQTASVKLLVTSRQTLGLHEAWVFNLGELPLPDTSRPHSLPDNSAVQLFVQSARRVAAADNRLPPDYPAIAAICRLVGGMPLGIELAAAWTRLLSCTEIAQEIERSLDFLTVNLRNLPPRHRSLRAVFDHSWRLLAPNEQQSLARLAVFQGGFTREAAAQVADAGLSLLSALVDRSLVQRTGSGRFNLHSVVRQYAADRLHADPVTAATTAQRHSAHFLGWLAAQDATLRGPRQKEGLAAIADELPNLRTAWQWAVEHRQIDSLQLAPFPFFYFFELRGLLHEGETTFRLAAETLQRTPDPIGRAHDIAVCRIHTYQAYFAFRLGQPDVAETLLEQVIAALSHESEAALLSYSARHLGLVKWSKGSFAEAESLLHTSQRLANHAHDVWGVAMARSYLGLIMHDQGRLHEAHTQLMAVEPDVRTLGDPRLIANTLLIAGRINLSLGHYAEAGRQLAECLTLTRTTQDPNSITYATLYLGIVKQAQGELAAGRQLILESIELFSSYNELVGVERASVALGFLELEAGNLQDARARFMAILQSHTRIHATRYILAAVLGAAGLHSRSGNPATALAWTLAVLRHPGLDWEAKQRAESLRADLEKCLSAGQIACIQAEQPAFDAVLAAVRRTFAPDDASPSS